MGGDFCLAFVGIEKDKDPDWKKGEEFIEKLKATHLSKWESVFGENAPDMEYFFSKLDISSETYLNEQELDMNDRTQACDMLRKCLSRVQSAWEHGTRDSTIIEIDGKDFLFSGGMSWGDPPTDTYEEITLFLDSGLARETGLKY